MYCGYYKLHFVTKCFQIECYIEIFQTGAVAFQKLTVRQGIGVPGENVPAVPVGASRKDIGLSIATTHVEELAVHQSKKPKSVKSQTVGLHSLSSSKL